MNKLFITGRVGRDAEQRTTQSGTSLASFSVAMDYGYGQNKETVWVKCTIWGKRAEALAQYIKKGDMISLVGECKVSTWEGDKGTQATLELNVDDVTLCGGSGNKSAQEAPQKASKPAQKPKQDDFDEDIPF